MEGKLKNILLCEDDEIDRMTIKRAFSKIKSTAILHEATNGEEGLDFLSDSNNARPDLILLDINMPRMNGLEFLKKVKENPEWSVIPVVILTSSNEEKDRLESFVTGSSGYMMKPVDFDQFVETIKIINQYWSRSELGHK